MPKFSSNNSFWPYNGRKACILLQCLAVIQDYQREMRDFEAVLLVNCFSEYDFKDNF
jgi:hypothetical protein